MNMHFIFILLNIVSSLFKAEEEMKRKVELIHQIRAMEAAPISRNKLVDFTETAGYRFLNEMSIAEVCVAECWLDLRLDFRIDPWRLDDLRL